MINRFGFIAASLLLLAGCATDAQRKDVVAEVGTRRLTRAEFEYWAGAPYDSLTAEQRVPAFSEWTELAMIEQEAEATGLHNDPHVERQVRKTLMKYYRSVLLARQAQPEITDSLITEYYNTHQSEFRRPVDSYLIEGFWSESEDSLKHFRRALERADTSELRSGFVIWEGKWLAQASELEPALQASLRAIKAGGLTPVLPFGEGYRLMRLHEVYPEGTQLSLDAVRQEIREQLLVEQSQRRQERWLTDLRSRYQPRIVNEGKVK
ncbi:MAG: peptidyl-prolyl cis-trans isomerase [bacterium]|nr:peptidyl-prolyl cis-trans isomerase [bacterium]